MGRINFWPADLAWPTDPQGRPLFGLLQLNLSELPTLPGWPAHGILQFFVKDDAFWGAHPLEPTQQDNFRLHYHDVRQPTQVKLLEDFSFLPAYEDLPLERELYLAVSGTLDSMPLPPEDYRFPQHLGPFFEVFGEDKWARLGEYRRAIGTVGHRLGGYPGFIQDDPRQPQDNWELLLQLDTDPQLGLRWGDYGVAHWFYRAEATASRSPQPAHAFSEVWYGWESS
ncbi:MAG: DUF1963 domain-containing protein [Bacteroidetes bacterium]|nr:MAG: DUF1963 domain-containing protein [Bacteroidota bacterium]